MLIRLGLQSPDSFSVVLFAFKIGEFQVVQTLLATQHRCPQVLHSSNRRKVFFAWLACSEASQDSQLASVS